MAVLKNIKFGSTSNPIQFTEVKPASGGVITATGTHTDLGDKNNPEYVIDLTIADDGTLVKDNGALKVGNVPAEKVSVAAGAGIEATNAQDAFKELKQKIDDVDDAAKSYSIVKVTTGLDSKVKEQYKLQETVGEVSDFVGEPINIYKDSSLKSVVLDGQELVFTYILDTGAEDIVRVDVSTFLAESEFKDGLQVTDHVVSVKLDSTSEKDSQDTPVDFLTVGAGGVKISGIKDEINRKIAALDVTDTAVAGQYVSAVNEADGKVSMTRANVSDAVLNGYAKGEKPASTAIAATDDVKGAIAKLEHQIDDAKAAATTKVEKDAAASHLTLTNATGDDGSVTYTIGESDIASKTDLDAEITARKAVDGQNGQTYAANTSAKYISGATSLNDADVKLDAAIKAEETRAKAAESEIAGKVGLTGTEGSLVFTPTENYGGSSKTVKGNLDALDTELKAVSDKLDAVQYKVSGTTLVFYGMTEKTGA